MTRVLALLSLLAAAAFGYLGIRQGASMVLREEPPAHHWPREGGVHTGGYVHHRGFVFYGGRSEWSGFRGGGPGGGK